MNKSSIVCLECFKCCKKRTIRGNPFFSIRVFLLVLRFSSHHTNQHFQIPIRSGIHGPTSLKLLSSSCLNKGKGNMSTLKRSLDIIFTLIKGFPRTVRFIQLLKHFENTIEHLLIIILNATQLKPFLAKKMKLL